MERFDVDFLGNEINIGDKVIFEAPKYRDFVIGTVISKAEKTCQIEYINNWNYPTEGKKKVFRQYYGQLIKHADVVPKSEVAREIVAKFKTKMHSEIARNELLAEYGDDFYEGRVDAFHTAIDHLVEIAMAYWCDARNEVTDV